MASVYRETALSAAELPVQRPSWFRRRRLGRGQFVVWFSAAIMLTFIVAGLIGPAVAPHDLVRVNLSRSLLPPAFLPGGDWSYVLGTDNLGRDILSRLLGGARVSLVVSVAAVFFSGAVGLMIGLVSGYRGGWLDSLLMRLTDTALAFPSLLLAIVIVAIYGPGQLNVVITLVAVSWAGYARVIRSEVIALKGQDFVTMSVVLGGGTWWIMRRHLIPNVMASMLVLSTLQLGTAILVEGSLSFLGLGVPPPKPSWGGMLAEGRNYLTVAWWLPVFPAVALSLTVLASNLLGDWLRSRTDPTGRR